MVEVESLDGILTLSISNAGEVEGVETMGIIQTSMLIKELTEHLELMKFNEHERYLRNENKH